LEAHTEEQAANLLSVAGYQLINLREMAGSPFLDKLLLKVSPIKATDIILFYKQMALLAESGLNIVTALELLESQASNRIFKRVLGEIISDVRAGSQLSTALYKHPQIFSQIHCQSLKVGEQTGGLEVVFRQIAAHAEKQVNSKKGIKNAMTYPVIAAVVALVVIAVMVIFVLPAFKNLYVSLGVKLPALNGLMLNLGDVLRENGFIILGVLTAAGVAGFIYLKTPNGRFNWDKLSLKFPIVGRINHLNELAKISQTISILYKSGLPMTEILPMVIEGTPNKFVAKALNGIRDDMLGGEGLSHPMTKHPVFLPMLVQMVRVGEETGNLDNTLMAVAQNYEAEADDRTRAFMAMIQPVMTIVIGLFVGLMALSLISAMYSIYGQLG
jgi:type IV pilus assembly protein PilC